MIGDHSITHLGCWEVWGHCRQSWPGRWQKRVAVQEPPEATAEAAASAVAAASAPEAAALAAALTTQLAWGVLEAEAAAWAACSTFELLSLGIC